MKKTILSTSVAAVLLASVPAANAAVNTFAWDGFFTMLDSGGAALPNSSLSVKVNQYQTPITGTMSFDDVTGAGTGTLVPFDFFSNDASAPAEAVGIKMQAIGDGAGGAGSLVLGNMLFNWNGSNGIPVSIVLDASGFFAGELAAGGANSAVPASDGTYTGPTWGYLGMGAIPLATTEFNTTNLAGCTYGSCIGVDSSGQLPLIVDNAVNNNEYAQGDGLGIAGNPMQDGAFIGSNASFDVTTFTFLSNDPNATIAQNCTFVPGDTCPTVAAVPVPAAVWLFGSGLLGLVGIARRKKAAV